MIFQRNNDDDATNSMYFFFCKFFFPFNLSSILFSYKKCIKYLNRLFTMQKKSQISPFSNCVANHYNYFIRHFWSPLIKYRSQKTTKREEITFGQILGKHLYVSSTRPCVRVVFILFIFFGNFRFICVSVGIK